MALLIKLEDVSFSNNKTRGDPSKYTLPAKPGIVKAEEVSPGN
jgi:hypothetical protein